MLGYFIAATRVISKQFRKAGRSLGYSSVQLRAEMREMLQANTNHDGAPIVLSPEKQVDLYRLIRELSVGQIVVGSIVPKARVPQMQHTRAVLQTIASEFPEDAARLSVLIPNMKGLQLAEADQTVGYFGEVLLNSGMCPTFVSKNLGQPNCEAAHQSVNDLIIAANKLHMASRVCLSYPIYNTSNERVPLSVTLQAARGFAVRGASIAVVDDGKANIDELRELLTALLEWVSGDQLSMHLHGPSEIKIRNAMLALQIGVHVLDVVVGEGLGGCPNKPQTNAATSNLSLSDAMRAIALFRSEEVARVEAACMALLQPGYS